jgi:hypothetical protein
VATSTITGTITDATGVAVASVPVTCRLMPVGGFRSADGSEVARLVSTTGNASGVYSFVLERNSGITPANSYYEIVEYIPAANGGTKVWNISVGASNQTVLAALVTPLAAQVATYLTQASADARYQALGAISSATPAKVYLDSTSPGIAGVSTSASRDDHIHPTDSTIWTAFTPTLTQSATVTKTVTYARYTRIGRMITVEVVLAVTGSGTAGNAVVIGLPVTAATASTLPVGAGYIFDTSATDTIAGAAYLATTTTIQLLSARATGQALGVGSGFAAALASGDVVAFSVTYEAST